MVTIAKEFQLGSDFPKIDYAMWRKQVEADLKGAPFDKRMFSRSYEGIELQSLYTEEIFPTADDPSGLPGYSPFVRGARPLGKGFVRVTSGRVRGTVRAIFRAAVGCGSLRPGATRSGISTARQK